MMPNLCKFQKLMATWTMCTSKFMTKVKFAAVALVIALSVSAEGKPLKFTEDAMCIPAGDQIWGQLGIRGDVNSFTIGKDITIGPAAIPKGCKITFGYSSELTSLEDIEDIASKRVVTVISNCHFKMAGVTLDLGGFDLEGCLNGYQQVLAPKNICGKRTRNFEMNQYYFDSGFLRCDHKPEEP